MIWGILQCEFYPAEVSIPGLKEIFAQEMDPGVSVSSDLP